MPRKITPSGGDRIVSMEADVNVNTGEIIFKYQSEVEELALETIGNAENIFFEEVPIGGTIILKYDDNYFRGWVLETLNSDCI